MKARPELGRCRRRTRHQAWNPLSPATRGATQATFHARTGSAAQVVPESRDNAGLSCCFLSYPAFCRPAMTGLTTALLHADREAGVEHYAVHKPLHTSTTYGYADTRELIDVFRASPATPTRARATRPPPHWKPRSR